METVKIELYQIGEEKFALKAAKKTTFKAFSLFD